MQAVKDWYYSKNRPEDDKPEALQDELVLGAEPFVWYAKSDDQCTKDAEKNSKEKEMLPVYTREHGFEAHYEIVGCTNLEKLRGIWEKYRPDEDKFTRHLWQGFRDSLQKINNNIDRKKQVKNQEEKQLKELLELVTTDDREVGVYGPNSEGAPDSLKKTGGVSFQLPKVKRNEDSKFLAWIRIWNMVSEMKVLTLTIIVLIAVYYFYYVRGERLATSEPTSMEKND